MKAIVAYSLTSKFAKEETIRTETCVNENQEFICDTNDVKGLKEAIVKNGSYSQLCEDGKPVLRISLYEKKLDHYLNSNNVLQAIKGDTEIKERERKIKDERERLQNKYGIAIDSDGITRCTSHAIKVDTIFDFDEKKADAIVTKLDEMGSKYKDIKIEKKEYIIKMYNMSDDEIEKELNEIEKEIIELKREIEKKRETFFRHYKNVGFDDEEIETIYQSEAKNRKKIEKNLWIEKFGSEHLKKGVKNGYDMGKIYRKERANKEFGEMEYFFYEDGYDTKYSPSLEALEFEDKLAEKYPYYSFLIVHHDGRELLEISDLGWTSYFLEIEI